MIKKLAPSILGLFFFLFPIPSDKSVSIPLALLAESFRVSFKPLIPELIALLIGLSFVLTLFFSLKKTTHLLLSRLFVVTPGWFLLRTLGTLFYFFVFFEFGPPELRGEVTGGLVALELLPVLLSVFLFASFFLSLLLDFGLLEFFGTLMTPLMRPLFRLPGRSSLDALSSWLGDGSVGILMTQKQFEAGHYTAREACVIATNFSAVSLSFSLVVISQVNLAHLFIPFYFVICLTGVIQAVLVPMLPPLRNKEDSKAPKAVEKDLLDSSLWEQACKNWDQRASQVSWRRDFWQAGFAMMAEMMMTLLPVVMAIGTLSLVVVEHTHLFDWLSLPFIPLLELLAIPEARQVAPMVVVGFADMFVPALLAQNLESEQARFFVATLSITQLIYLSEVGAILLSGRLPLKFWEIFVIFLWRTLIALPIVAIASHLIV